MRATAVVVLFLAGADSIMNATCSSLGAYPGYSYCVNVLSSDPSSGNAKDARDLAIIAANATSHNITQTAHTIDELLVYLQRCSADYSHYMGDLVDGRDPTNKLFYASIVGPDSCNVEFDQNQEWGFTKELLTDEDAQNAALTIFTANVALLNSLNKSLALPPSPSPASIINATCYALPDLYEEFERTLDLAVIAIHAVQRNITSAVRLIDGLVSDLAGCKAAYGAMAQKVGGALEDLVARRDHVGAANKLADASHDPVSCDAGRAHFASNIASSLGQTS
ncbi:hypothetical protein BRADI_1g78335v3 [Brachypodium distachyon]|uniref:Pectinesterase inhibitor domain-containing protein n=1 Tax=Brachypodium distachyon TaxID=15368 RepID=A0A0Q3HN65_BRADI|nr:hypothetical protein BRADI_1g78335v3 [Brachypodium distachyon]